MNLLDLQSDPATFQNELQISTGSGARRFGDCMADFQRERFAAVNPLLLAVARHEAPPMPRVWDERTKGASKDTDWAVNLLWLLAFSRRPLRMQVGAFDQEQADEVRLIVKDILRTDGQINAFLRQVIDVRTGRIVNEHTGSVVEILTSDQYGSHGSRIDFLLMNELTHQPSSGFAETLFDNLDKMPNALGVVATNSGHDPSWQLDWKRVFADTPARWIMLEYNRPSPWVSLDALGEAEKRNPPGRFHRLWHGVWSPTEGDPALSAADVAAAFREDLAPMTGRERDWLFVAGVDLGLTRDFAAVVVLGVPKGGKSGRIRLAHNKLWKPAPGRKINLLEIEQHLLDLDKQYRLEFCAFDPWQAEHLAQTIEADSGRRRRNQQRLYHNQPWMREVPPSGANLRDIASLTIESFTDRRLVLYPCEPLKRDLLKLRAEEKSYGVRLISPRDGEGHGDTFSAFSLALLVAHEVAGKQPVCVGIFDLFNLPVAKRALSAFERRQVEYEMLDTAGSDNRDGREELKDLMRR